MMSFYSVAIDGPSGAGKSSIAKACAKIFEFLYVDTGAIYRTVGLSALRQGLDTHDGSGIIAMLPGLEIDLNYADDGLQHMFLNGEDVTSEIRIPEVSIAASDVSAIPEVRAFLMDLQRNLAKTHSVLMDGRDIGTVVLPDAGLKIFLTASAEERANRRLLELQEKGQNVTFEEVLLDINYRDKNDSERTSAPLRVAEGAVVVNTTDMNFDESVDAVAALIRERFSL